MNERDLRLILTEKCNYRCTFCHHEGVAHEIFQTLNNDDYLFLYDVVKQKQKIEWVTLTGGEPLRYAQIESLAKLLHNKWAKITMVTNGSLLHKYPEIGKRINRINVSLHTLDQQQYHDITETNIKIEQILKNIALMKKLHPNLIIRLNATVVKWRNDNKQDIAAMIAVADQYGLSIKFVELYPNTDPDFVPLQSIESILEELDFEKYQETPRQMIYGRWKRIVVLTKIFCGLEETNQEHPEINSHESDIFVSPDGLISPYPTSENKVSLYEAIKTKNTQEIEKLLCEAIDEVEESKIYNKTLV